MSQVNFSNLIHLSINRTELILLKSFSLRKWLRLTFIAFFAGTLASGGCHFNLPISFPSHSKTSPTVKAFSSTSTSTLNTTTFSHKMTTSRRTLTSNLLVWLGQLRPVIWRLFFVGIFSFLALMIVFMWLNARFEFIWWEAMVNNTDQVREPFRRYQKEGDSLFNFNIFLFLIFLFITGTFIWSIFIFVTQGGMPTVASLKDYLSVGLIFILCFLIFIIFTSIFFYIIYPLIITIMAIDHCNFTEAWGRFGEIYRNHMKNFWLFVLLSMGIGMVAGIAVGIVMIIAFIILLLVGLIIGAPLALIFWKSQTLLWSLGIIIGVPYFFMSMIILMLLYLPVAVFFRSLSLYFLSSLNCGYEPLPLAKESIGGV